ncbi:HOG (high osmolarity glycerol) pathway protein [Linnemannia zychae]|nr:HOG (high osmolarity glycerol) pathway protein [Linnemannia zychae]
MALVSMPSCHSATGDAVSTEGFLNKKRASIHYPDDSTAAKRLSLHFGHRCRSLSESRAFVSSETVAPESYQIKNPSDLESTSQAANTSYISGAKDEPVDKEALMSLPSSTMVENNDKSFKDRFSTASTWDDKTTDSGFFPSAGSSDSESTDCDLVVAVRDFAYPKSHPYHRGDYPPEPAYEESDIEEDYEEDHATEYNNETENEDRTQGQARGLYDFDAENESELSFKEGDYLWIHYRQFPGWLLGEMEGRSGLVPENYVQLL